MHSAPSVSYPVGRSSFALGLAVCAWLLGAGAAAAWWMAVPALSWRVALVFGVLAAAGGAAGLAWRRSASGDLAWNGEAWGWSQGAAVREGTVETALDLQRWLLLRWAGEGQVRWLWLERNRLPARWDDLRRAVYSRARPPALPGATPPAART